MNPTPVKVLLVDDDEDDFIITRSLITEMGQRYRLDWINNYDDALTVIQRREHDICLLDYRLGEHTGLDLLRALDGSSLPMILLTGQGDDAIDREAMKAGAADYLVKGQLTANQLDRAIRYAIERKRAEERLRRERDLISRIMETSPVGILVADQAGCITFANHGAEQVLGLTHETIERHACSVLEWQVADAEGVPQESRTPPLRQLLETGRPVQGVRHAVELPGNRRLVLSINATPLFDHAGKNDGMVVAVEDITDRLGLEAQLRQSQKMELVGQLAAGVAHDINNVLTIIQGHTGLLLHVAPAASQTAKSLKQIAAASDRAAGFVRHLLMFSRKQVVQTRLLDLNTVLRNLHAMLKPMLGEQIKLDLNCQPNLPAVAGDASMTEQIVMNLAVNARDAMVQGGTLTIETIAIEIPMALVRQHPEARPGVFVCLSVRDTGCGMDRKTMQRIFEPFFTTKEVGKGTGLGLSTVYGIVRQHQGWVEVESEIGVGTVFKVFLPVAEAQTDLTPVTKPVTAETVNGGHETILVVEDETGLLKVLSRVLERYHYKVLSACSGPEALRLWDENGGQVDLLLTDMIMPGISGADLVNQLKLRKPALKVIMSSGYCDDLAGRDLTHADIQFLPKPYQPHTVAQLVRRTLDGHAPLASARSGDTSHLFRHATQVIGAASAPVSAPATHTANTAVLPAAAGLEHSALNVH
jgi:PAS domain S-box-containing protein